MSNQEREKQEETEDPTIKMLNAKRLIELRRRASSTSAKNLTKPQSLKPLSKRERLLKSLTDRGDEVLFNAEARYPREMSILIPKLADLLDEKKISSISGGELLQFLRAMGLRISVSTSISVEDHGKFVSLSDKLREKSESQ